MNSKIKRTSAAISQFYRAITTSLGNITSQQLFVAIAGETDVMHKFDTRHSDRNEIIPKNNYLTSENPPSRLRPYLTPILSFLPGWTTIMSAHKESLMRSSKTSAHENALTDQEIVVTHESSERSARYFEEIVTLAKENHRNFYARFQELYPRTHGSLLSINPDLKLSDLTLCAYIYLDFSTKDIAAYTFKSVRTVQNRKSALRKRLGISSAADLYIWIKYPANCN